MEQREVNVEIRESTGKGGARKLRAGSLVPAVFYGPHLDKPVNLALTSKELSVARQGGKNALLTLKTKSSSPVNGKVAVLKEHQVHPVTGASLHVDFYEIRMDEEIKVSVALVLTGKAAGVAEGGVLQQVSRELEVRCLPGQVPDKITVDVSALNIGDSIHVDEITLPQGVKVVGQVNYTIAAVVAPEEEVKEVAPSAVTEAAVVGAEATPGAEGAAPAGDAKAAPGAAAPKDDKKAAAAPAKDEKKADKK
jgi:large subunit ribosomal protein L25